MSESQSINEKTIDIPVSRIATLIGLNPYEHRYKALLDIWEKNEPDDFHNVLSKLEDTLSIKITRENDLQMLKRLKSETGLSTIDRLKDCRTSGTQEDLLRNQRALLRDVQNSTLTKEKKDEVSKIIRSETNKSYGQHNEKSAIAYYEKEIGLTVDSEQKKYTKVIAKSSPVPNYNYQWKLVGRIDGLNSNGEVVEIKNRANRLFNVLKTYEKIQLQTYLKMTKANVGYLVEYLKSKKNEEPKINIIKEDFDPEFWTYIHTNLCRFIEIFHFLQKNSDLKKVLLMGDEKKIIEIVDQLFKD